jgi:phage shock protein C
MRASFTRPGDEFRVSDQGCPRCAGAVRPQDWTPSGTPPDTCPTGQGIGDITEETCVNIHESFGRQGLYRPLGQRVLGGVCAGLGRRFGLNPWPARLLFVLVLMVLPGSQLIVYPVLWVLMPPERYTSPVR